MDVIKNISPPSRLFDIHIFLSMFGYYKHFIPYFAKLAEPLVQLLQRDDPFLWGNKQDAVFRDLYEALSSSPVLVPHDFANAFVLFTNASGVALGAILAKFDDEKVDYNTAYYIKFLSKAKCNYNLTKRECLVVLLAIDHFPPFL